MRHLVIGLFVFFLAILQTTVLRSAQLFGIIPNLIFIGVVCYGLYKGNIGALVFGLACGLLLDFLGGRTVGVNTLLCTYTAYLCMLIHERLFNRTTFVAAVFVLIFSFVYEFLFYILNYFIWGHMNIGFAIVHKIIPAMLYNTAATFVLFPLIRILCAGNTIFGKRKRG